jgi:type IV pilus assembly protein PilO
MAAITKEQIVNLPKLQKALILVGFIIVLGAVWYFLLVSPVESEISKLRGEMNKIKEEIQVQEKAKKEKTNLQAQIKELEKELQVLRSKLPEEKEIPTLLSTVNEIGRLNGLEFLLFKQDNAVRRDYYSEIPVQVQVTGPYHQVALFLNRVATLDRIIQISKLRLDKYKAVGTGGRLEASMQATTYKYETEPLPKAPAKPAAKPPETKK